MRLKQKNKKTKEMNNKTKKMKNKTDRGREMSSRAQHRSQNRYLSERNARKATSGSQKLRREAKEKPMRLPDRCWKELRSPQEPQKSVQRSPNTPPEVPRNIKNEPK